MNIAKFSKVLLLNLLFVILLSGCIQTPDTIEPIPTPTPIPNWVEYNIEDISIQLPSGFEPIEYEIIEEEESAVLFRTFRENFGEISKSQLVIIEDDPVLLDQTTEYLWLMMDALPESHQWISNEQLPLNTFPHGLMLSRAYEKDLGFLTYHTHFIFLDNKTYIFVFTTVADKYFVDNPEVDQIMNSVRIGENGYGNEERSNGLCYFGLGLIFIFFVLNLWIRRKTWKTIKFP